MNKESVRERVKLGAEFLDENCPGWYVEISLSRLDMDSHENCVLGQLYGSYHEACDKFGWGVFGGGHYGFDWPYCAEVSRTDMHAWWTEEITRRREALAVTGV